MWKSLPPPFRFAEAISFSAREADKGNELGTRTYGHFTAALVPLPFCPALRIGPVCNTRIGSSRAATCPFRASYPACLMASPTSASARASNQPPSSSSASWACSAALARCAARAGCRPTFRWAPGSGRIGVNQVD